MLSRGIPRVRRGAAAARPAVPRPAQRQRRPRSPPLCHRADSTDFQSSKTGKPLTGEAVAQVLKAAGKAVGVSDSVRVSPHTCRHTFAQIQLKNGLDLYSLSRLMGHENISITQRYLQGLQDRDIILNSNRTSPLMNL